MPRPQIWFLLRAGVLVLTALVAWWIFLLDPLLDWMRVSGDFTLAVLPGAAAGQHVTIKPDGNWLLQLPVPSAAANRADLQRLASGGSAAPRKVRSFKMEVSRIQVALYTLPLPVFLALMFTAGLPLREMARSIALGCGIVALVMPLALTVWGVTTIREYFQIDSAPAIQFLRNGAAYLNNEVLPYLLPLLLAIGLNRELRAQIFSFVPAEGPATQTGKRRRAAKRRTR